jgi:hypothetical protein
MGMIRKIIFEKNKITSHFRELPNFLVLGNTFCGKTLLYNYLIQHKLVIENLKEETAFFNVYFEKGVNWYKANFPSALYKKSFKKTYGKIPKVGETINLPYQEIPKRVHELMPNSKIIIILRNPIDRAYASHKWLVDAGMEKHSFENAIKQKVDRRSKTNESLTENKIEGLETVSSYLYRSIYFYDIKNWAKFFPMKNMMFVKSEDLFKDPLSTVNKTLEFLGLEKLDGIESKYNNENNNISISNEFRNELNEFFKPYNQKLYEYVGKDFGWK